MGRRWWVVVFGVAVLVVQTGVIPAEASTGFTTRVSPNDQTNATEPSVAVDRSDGTVWVAWQASGTHAARSNDGGRTFTQVLSENDIGDVDVRVGGPTNCGADAPLGIPCLAGTHRVYVSSIEEIPGLLQTHLAYTDNRGANWTFNQLAAFNPSFIDRPWLAVSPGASANQDHVYIAYHDFSVSQIWVAASNDGGQTFGPSVDVFASAGLPAFANDFCNTVPSGIEVNPETGDVYVQWITADPVQNVGQGCNISQIQNFHQVWVAHSAPGGLMWDAHQVFNGPSNTNTDKIFATIGVDDSGIPGAAGNVYSVFADNLNLNAPTVFDIWFSHSADKGNTWAAPVKANSDGGNHYFPWIAAGTTGRVDFIWLHTPDTNPSDANLSPWYVTFAQTINGNSGTPKFAQTSASSGIMHVGGICTNGIFCSLTGGNRDLADSISIVIDRGGSAALAWTDQGNALHGPTHIEYGCVTAQHSAIVGADQGLSCKGPAGP